MPSFRINSIHLFFAFVGLTVAALGQSHTATASVLTNAAQIRELAAADAARSLSVELRGVVMTEAGPTEGMAVVIWDGTAGVYLLGPTNAFSGITRGDQIAASGVTDPGEFAPIVKVRSVQKLGTAPTPAPHAATLEELLSGRLDAQWVEIYGVVRSVAEIPKGAFGKWHMDLAVGGSKVSVVSDGARPGEVDPDARVRVRAACFYQFTQKRQVLRPMLLIPNGVPIEVEKSAPVDGFSAPVRPVGSLLEFSPESGSGNRVHVRGVVTHQEAGTIVWIRDESGALRIRSTQSGALRPGDVIDVLGFPRFGSYTPELEDAVFRKAASGPAPVATPVVSYAAAFDHQADLISLEAKLLELQPLSDGWVLTLEHDGSPLKALFRPAPRLAASPPWRTGSLVRVSGICSVAADDAQPVLSGVWHPESFQLLVRSADDVVTLRPPPWWTPAHFIMVLVLVTGASLAVTAVVMLLARRRLRDQSQRRAMAEAEFAAILSERNRVAREIHDTLAQGLVATAVQLRLAKKGVNGDPVAFTKHLDLAQQLVSENLEEARKSIWNMRSQVLETGDLPSAIKGILTQMADGTNVQASFGVSGEARRLAPVLENNILRVGQEAISNAVRHAEAKTVSVTLSFGEDFTLTVRDDGHGFDPAKPPPGEGGFGLVGMKERVANIKGSLDIQSTPGCGTEINLRIPIAGE